MYCITCGRKLPDDVSFCGGCGKPVKKKMEENSITHLVIQLQKGDMDAFQELYDETQSYVRYYTGVLCSESKASVEDVVQDVYLAIYKNINALQDPRTAWGWIKSITRNTALNQVKKDGKRNLLTEEESFLMENQEVTDTFLLPEDMVVQKEKSILLKGMIDELSDTQKMVLLEHYYNGMQISEIAKAYDMLEGTVKANLSRARVALREKVQAYQKKTGVSLRSVAALPLFYMLFKNNIKATACSKALPQGVAAMLESASVVQASVVGANGERGRAASADMTGTSVTGSQEIGTVTASEAGREAMKQVGKGAVAKTISGGKVLATKVLLGVTAAAVVGIGAVKILKPKESDETRIERVVETYEDAYQTGDYDKIWNCCTEESRKIVQYVDMFTGAVGIGSAEDLLMTANGYEIEILKIEVDGDEAIAYCQETWAKGTEDAEVKEISIAFDYEKGEWKIDLWESNMMNLGIGW